MKGRIMVDIADDDGALFQVVQIKTENQRSCVRITADEQVAEFKLALEKIKAAPDVARIQQIVN